MTSDRSGILHSRATPHLALLHGCMFLSGFGTVFLGPVLPALAANAHATDSSSGLFFTAQFIGAFFGGVTTSRRLWLSLIRGSVAATLGFAALALCVYLHATPLYDAAALLPLGFGVGQMLTSANLLASQRFVQGRGAALARINFSLSLGAVFAPFLLGWLLSSVALHVLLFAAAVLFAVSCVAAFINAMQRAITPESEISAAAVSTGLTRTAFVYFASLLLLYGGVETSISGWITTFETRYGASALKLSTLGATALWIGITAGRVLAPVLLRRLRERTMLTATLGVAAALVAVLSAAHGAVSIIALAFLLGLALAAWFPLVLSAMMTEGASAGEAGSVIAASGLGAASLPFLVGAVSRGTGSLRVALLVPLCGLLVLFGMSFRRSTAPIEAGLMPSAKGV
jgi:FHS family glucose/mannose:H+ symporter-like MFS transporter